MAFTGTWTATPVEQVHRHDVIQWGSHPAAVLVVYRPIPPAPWRPLRIRLDGRVTSEIVHVRPGTVLFVQEG